MLKGTVLGLSVGTQLMGLAMVQKGSLEDWQVKTFSGKWDWIKLKAISLNIERYINRHGIASVILKVPEPCRSSPAIEQLTKSLVRVCEQKSVQVRLCTINDLKDICEANNKTELMKATLVHYPELTYLLDRAKKDKKIYYVKIFEAVLATLL